MWNTISFNIYIISINSFVSKDQNIRLMTILMLDTNMVTWEKNQIHLNLAVDDCAIQPTVDTKFVKAMETRSIVPQYPYR